MVNRIQKPFYSKKTVLVLCRILQLEEPYSSKVAESLSEQRDNIQPYISTMVDKGWLEKEKSGRKNVLRVNPWSIWEDSEVLGKIRGLIKEEEIDSDLKNFLNSSLLYMIQQGTHVFEEEKIEELGEQWVYYKNDKSVAQELKMYSEDNDREYIANTFNMYDILINIYTVADTIEGVISEDYIDLEGKFDSTGALRVELVEGYLDMLRDDTDSLIYQYKPS
jgi:uncharacterized protein YbcC (UPF0753/DUF2309 family)